MEGYKIKKFYDKNNKRLIVIDQEATSDFWDSWWKKEDFLKEYQHTAGATNWFDKHLKMYLGNFVPAGAKILDGGCGTGQYVYALSKWGYDAYGVDFAQKTVDTIKKNFPDMKISLQDVRNLDFTDNYFDAYYSGGVIEHFWEGYDEIINEAYRVLKKNGYLFISVPNFSPLLQFKALLGTFEVYTGTEKPEGFYQFCINHKKEINHIKQLGFKFVLKKKSNAMRGLCNEISTIAPIAKKFIGKKNFFTKCAKSILNHTLTVVAGSGIMLVFKKTT
ncbi:MAG: class I SAM-dependent methyltransferase [Candidatus Auribacterota bacterium]|jgi:ubiquinone/menaquinone biosynthesis C-methylase UbiE|nr:class I SAM-dependent methyltransferase [Candidatus Auribacterota bacterium]